MICLIGAIDQFVSIRSQIVLDLQKSSNFMNQYLLNK